MSKLHPPPPPSPSLKGRSERSIIFLVGAVQFVNILDFMMVVPLGPEFSDALGVPVSAIGYVSGMYTVSAAAAGVIASFFLDRFDRRLALSVCLLGLVIGTAAGGFAVDMNTLVATRLLAGAFGGPATSLVYSIVADVVPAERRGRAMGSVMGAFAAASVIGVPLGLELARYGSWQTPFFAVAGLGLVLTALAFVLLPPLTGHLSAKGPGEPALGLRYLLSKRTVQYSYLMTAVTMMGGFIIIPNIPGFVVQNLGYPREKLSLLYFFGGIVSFITTRSAGHFVDRFGSFRVGLIASISLTALIIFGFGLPNPPLPVMFTFVGFMLVMGLRNVSYNTLTSKVPTPQTRARFMSIQSAVQHFAAAAGAILSARMLSEDADQKLVGMPAVAGIGVLLALALPPLLRTVELKVGKGPLGGEGDKWEPIDLHIDGAIRSESR